MPQPFLDVVFPNAVARGATGGPGFKTEIVALASGSEQRNRAWALARGEWDISTGVRTREQMAEVVALFYAAAGRAHSFRFRDWADFEAVAQAMEPVSATVFQLRKRYQFGAFTYDRTITKPEAGSVQVKVGASVVTPQSIDHATGRVTFASAPAQTPTAGFRFHVPVRFDADKLPVQVNAFDNMVVPSINLVEVRE